MEEKIKTFLQKIIDELPDSLSASAAKDVIENDVAIHIWFPCIMGDLINLSMVNLTDTEILETLKNGKTKELIEVFERALHCANLAKEASDLLNSIL